MSNEKIDFHKRNYLIESNKSILLETDEYFIPLDMNIERSAFEWLVAGLKTTADNLGILHRNVTGSDFFNSHSVLETYYKKVYEILDDVVETVISLGGRELSMYESCKICPSLRVQNFNSESAFMIVSKMFQMLINGFERCQNFVPSDVYSKFEEYIYWMRKESNYKLMQFIKEK